MAHEDVDPELFFELDDGLADTGLRGVQGLGCFGQVQVAAHGLLHEAKLVQVHLAAPLSLADEVSADAALATCAIASITASASPMAR